MGYLTTIVTNFSQTILRDPRYVASDDGRTVLLEARGDLIHAGSGMPYTNVYVFVFTIVDGSITAIAEYANPVTFGKLVGAPLG